MKYQLTKHAQHVLQEREIPIEFMESVLQNPQLSIPDENDPELEHLLAKIPEFGGRVLRIIVNKKVDPDRIVTVYYDRKMRDKL